MINQVFPITIEEVEITRKIISPYVRRTPMAPAPWLHGSQLNPLHLKLENLQVAGSFKTRGAFYNLLSLSEEERNKGVYAASGGNHGFSLSYAAKVLGVETTIILPESAAQDRVLRIESLGGKVVKHGKTPSEAIALAAKEASEQGKALIHPFDGVRTWQSTGTLGLEILEDIPDVDCVIVAIGGGGLIAGVASVVKQRNHHVRVIGVEPVGAASMLCSIQAGQLSSLASVNTIADTLSPRTVSESTFRIAQAHVDEFILVSDEEMLDAMKVLWREYNQLVEPAGVAVLAAVLSGKVSLSAYTNPVAIICGGNAAAEPCFHYYQNRI